MSEVQNRERDAQTRAVERVTGTWWCTAGQHRVRDGMPAMHRGRKVCPVCMERINRRRRK